MQKMQDEGSEGFAAGPWPDSEGTGGKAPATMAARSRSMWPSANSIVAALALVLIVTGVVGAYLSNKSKREAVIAQVDAIFSEPLRNPDAERLQALEARLANSLTPYEKRLRDLELNLTQTRSFYDERLEGLEQRLMHVNAPYEERLNKMEKMLIDVSDPYNEKLHGIEQRLVHTTNRLDELSAVMASLANSAEAIIEANVAMMTDPPAALPIKPAVVSRDNVTLPPPQAAQTVALRQPAVQTVAPQAPGEPAADLPASGKIGPWVINIGSYAKETMAIRKQAAFLEKGVATERMAANVGNRTLYRVHVAGFNSRREASAQARTIQQQLGLKETWIKRR
ncbi:MAG: SPOR domain-containing protein [Gammaproteobacteria bacterium]|nr:SPOR domain-containing protein [Gammaproteobacteria bacterium]MDH3560574.1 SPOR domain-containing protein [Gammaproteobacteria bacterium]